MTKRVLLISFAYYPANYPGSHRTAKLAKYLPEFGWTPVVVCGDWTAENSRRYYDPSLAARPDTCRVVRVPHSCATRVGRGLSMVAGMLFPYYEPVLATRRMLAAAQRLAAAERFDAIWSTYMNGMAHTIASRVAARHGTPWVADFRDIPDMDFSPLRLWYTVRQEVRVCRRASALTTVSQPLADGLARRYTAPIYVIPNGFDPDDFPRPTAVRPDRFTIAYFGILYKERDPRPIFEAIDMLAARGAVKLDDLRLQFYGSEAAAVNSLARGYRCYGIVEAKGRVPRAEALRLEQQAAILLTVGFRGAQGVLTSKLFEYLAARRPILSAPCDDGAVKALLEETGAGISAGTPAEIADALKAWYDEWKRTGTVTYTGLPEKIALHTREAGARQLAEVLDSLVPGGVGGGYAL